MEKIHFIYYKSKNQVALFLKCITIYPGYYRNVILKLDCVKITKSLENGISLEEHDFLNLL